jgi:hypothetical protein
MSAEGSTEEFNGRLENNKLRFLMKNYQGVNEVHYFVISTANCIKDGMYEYCKD